MKRYYDKEGECSECHKPTKARIFDESFAEVKAFAVLSVCCEARVLDDNDNEIGLRDLEEARY